MKTSQFIVLGVAVAAAGGAGIMAKNMTSAPPPQSQVVVETRPAEPAIKLTEVLVLSEDMTMGQPLEEQMKWQPWPTETVNEQYITREAEPDAIEKLRGVVVRVPMSVGEPVRKTRLVGFGKSFMSSILPAGKRAIATQISADTSAGGFILPNDYVDVIMTRRATAKGVTGEGFKTETILKNIRVLAIDQTIQEDEEGRKVKVGETATLELTAQQAEIITVAQQMADRLTLALRSVKDADEQTTGEADYLVSAGGDRAGVVRMIKGGEVSEEATKK